MGQRISQKVLHPLTAVTAASRTVCTNDYSEPLTGQHGTLYVKVIGASCGTLMFDVAEDPATGEFYRQTDREWWANDGAATAAGQLYCIPLDGYSFQSGHKYRFYFTPSSNAGSVYVFFVTSEVEHGADISLGDIEVSLETLDDCVTVDDTANTATKVLMGGIVYDDVAPNVLDEGDSGYVRGSARREAYVQIRDAGGNERGAVVGGAGELLASVHDGTTKATVTTGTIKGLNVAASDGTTQPVVTTGTLKGWNVAANDGTTQPTVTTGTIKAWNVAVSDGETLADVIVTSAAAQPTSIIGAAAEVVDFDTVGTDLTGCVGILAASATGAHPVLGDADGHLQVDALSTSLDGAIYVDDADWSDASSKHLLTGGIYQSVPQSITDGDTGPLQTDVHGNLKTAITDGTNTAVVGTGTAKVLQVGINDGEKLAAVVTNAAMADDLDGVNGLVTASVMHGYVNDDTTHSVLVDSSGHLQVDLVTPPSLVGTPTKYAATGAGAIALGTGAVAASCLIKCVTVHFSAAPTTSENLTVTIDVVDGAAYDTVVYKVDPSVGAQTDLCYTPSNPITVYTGDAINIAYTNTDARTYGVRLITVV